MRALLELLISKDRIKNPLKNKAKQITASIFGLAHLLIAVSGVPVKAQAVEQATTSATKRNFSYTITSNYGVSVSSSGTPGYEYEGSASMGILPGSYVKNKVGTGNVSITPSGIVVNGVEAGLNLNLDPEQTKFQVKLKNQTGSTQTSSTTGSGSATDGTNGATASAGIASISATGTATTNINAEYSESSTTSAFQKSF